jgi:hypothetical protein
LAERRARAYWPAFNSLRLKLLTDEMTIIGAHGNRRWGKQGLWL